MRRVIVGILLLTSMSASALVLNGKKIETDRVDIEWRSEELYIDFTERSDSTPRGNTTPTPKPPVQPPVSSQGINWSAPGGRQSLVSGDEIKTFAFFTTSNPSYAGNLNISEMTGYEGVSRRMWISRTPNGTFEEAPIRCRSAGVSVRVIQWAQTENRFRCHLQTDTQYFLRIQQFCDGLCRYYFSPLTNGTP